MIERKIIPVFMGIKLYDERDDLERLRRNGVISSERTLDSSRFSQDYNGAMIYYRAEQEQEMKVILDPERPDWKDEGVLEGVVITINQAGYDLLKERSFLVSDLDSSPYLGISLQVVKAPKPAGKENEFSEDQINLPFEGRTC